MAEVFQKLLNMSIAAGWLILAVVVLRFVLKKAPKRFVLLLWAVVGLRLALPWSIESALSLIPSAATLPEGIMMERTPSLDTGIPALNNAINPGFAAAFAPEPAASANPLQVLLPIASLIWLAGAAAMLIWALASWLRLRSRMRTAVRLEGNVYESEMAGGPFVLGLFRPRIYLPFGLGEAERGHVLAHEREHIRRGDQVVKLLGFLLLCLHWFNPLVWLAYALLCRDIELACDERVVRNMGSGERADYSQTLLELSRPKRFVSVCPLAFGEVPVKSRVKSVLNYKKPAFWLVLLAVVVCVGAAVCFLTDPNTAAEDTGEDESGRVAITTELDENFPEQVLYYAVNCTVKQVEMMIWLKVERAEITDLACYAETKGPGGVTLLLFKLGARYKLAEPESVMPVGGMLIEDGWLTRLDDGGDRYMLLAREGEDWLYIGLVTEQTLSEYGTDYNAAVLGEYARYLTQQSSGAPGPVYEAAQSLAQEKAAQLSDLGVSETEIITLELCAETPCPDGGTLYLYGVAARYKSEGIGEKMPAGGTVTCGGSAVNIYVDGDWFTLLKSGLPTDYLLMLCKDGVWEWLGTADRDTVMGGDGYGGNYPAAVTGEYARIKAAQTPVIRLADGLDALPEQLISFACGGVDMLAETSGFGITEIEINVLELVTELEAPEGGTLCLYRLGARYKLADGNNAMPAGGMVIENGWITRLHSGGDCYMLLLRDGEVWSYIGILSELTVTELGGDYDAAALDLYERIFAGGVNWTSNLAVSSLYGIQFMFDFDFDWTRIEASCNAGWLQDSRVNYNGQSLSLEPGLELRWMPDTDTASTTIYFTVYNGDEAQYSGSISITRIAQPSLIENTYRAILNCPGLTMTAKGSNMGALISPAE